MDTESPKFLKYPRIPTGSVIESLSSAQSEIGRGSPRPCRCALGRGQVRSPRWRNARVTQPLNPRKTLWVVTSTRAHPRARAEDDREQLLRHLEGGEPVVVGRPDDAVGRDDAVGVLDPDRVDRDHRRIGEADVPQLDGVVRRARGLLALATARLHEARRLVDAGTQRDAPVEPARRDREVVRLVRIEALLIGDVLAGAAVGQQAAARIGVERAVGEGLAVAEALELREAAADAPVGVGVEPHHRRLDPPPTRCTPA